MTLAELSVALDNPGCLGTTPAGINATFKAWSKLCHPDLNPGDRQAEQLFTKLCRVKAEALTPGFTLKLGGKTYQLAHRIATGDVATVYGGLRYDTPERDTGCIFKLSRFPGAVRFLAQENTVLRELTAAFAGRPVVRYLPVLLDSHEFRNQKRVPQRLNVFDWKPALRTLHEVKTRHPLLDPRHLAWIFNRLLEVLGGVHRQDYVHGALTPDHVLLCPEDHGAVLIGWGQSVKAGKPLTAISKRYEASYPREVKNKEGVTAATDLYMVARLMIWLAGPELDRIPFPVLQFWRSLLMESQFRRPNDAWALRDEFRGVLRSVYGKPSFLPLEM